MTATARNGLPPDDGPRARASEGQVPRASDGQAASGFPSRFREAEARGVKLGRGLRWLGGVDGVVDERLMERIGTGLLERDEAAAKLVSAMQTRADGTERVSRAQLEAALSSASPDDVPPALGEFMETVSAVPGWVDWELIERGAALFRRLGQNSADVLTQLSLIGGYRFGGPTDLLVCTGGLTGTKTRRRLAETQHWATSISHAGALRPGGEAWRLTVHVRVMHAQVNATLEPRWDVGRWGLPINQADQAGTLGLFDGTVLLGCRALGVPISADEARAYMHLWRYVGWLMGVDSDFLTDDEHERHRINYHIILAAPDISAAGPQLARAIYAAQTERGFTGWPGPLQPLRSRWEQERLLSMLTTFLGVESVRELGLSPRPPWAFAYLWPLNTWRYRIQDQLPGASERRDTWGRQRSDAIVASYFRDQSPKVANLS